MSEAPSTDDAEIGSTRISAPRPLSAAKTLLVGASVSTTLPDVQWTQAGPTLEARSLPRYQTLDVLGEGGMGEVVKARDNDIGRTVAVKRLRPDLQHPELFARFVEEVRTVGQLEHPNIVPIHDAGLDDQGYFFVMKHVQGDSLEAIIKALQKGDPAAHARWTFERRMEVMRKVLEALRYAHGQGVIHRDLKPANILVGPMGEVFVLDWGVARRDRSTAPDVDAAAALPATGPALQTRVGALIGTPHYMAPEQARGEPVDARSDLYSLCLTTYEFMTLQHPWAELTELKDILKAATSRPVPDACDVKNAFQPKVYADIRWLLDKGVAKDPALRYQSAEELLRRLDDRAEGNVPVQCPITFMKRVNYAGLKVINERPLLIPVIAVVVLGGLSALVVAAVR